jgi:MarR-like DNA-binding transcriptional regulator SgrR of sgrS sRNA
VGRYPGGAQVEPADVIADWEERLRDPGSAHRWLLAEVAGVESWIAQTAARVGGLRSDGRFLVVCLDAATGDFEARLAHPALSHLRRNGAREEGPGPFLLTETGGLEVNPDFTGDRPYLERIRPVEANDDPRLLFGLDEIDVAILYGGPVGALLEEPSGRARLERLESWDRDYFLWIDPSKRWVNDPAFRAWIAETIDREALVRFLFDGRGEPVFSLSSNGSERPAWTPPQTRPFSTTSHPRLALHYPRSDRLAADIAGRIGAALSLEGVELAVEPRERNQLRRELEQGEVAMALLAHHPPLRDPVLRLLDTIWWLGPGAADAIGGLRQASGRVDPELRADAAWLAEYGLLVDLRLVPLIRLHAWLATDPALRDVAAGPSGRLRLDRAWWQR